MIQFKHLANAGLYHGITSSQHPYVTKEDGLSEDLTAGYHPVQMEQIHQNMCMVCVEEDANTVVEGADALISNLSRQLLVIRTADCVPLLLSDPAAGIVGVIHGGRKGVSWGIVRQSIDQMKFLGASPERILVGIGPHIRVKNYEIGEDVVKQIGDSSYKIFIRDWEGKMYFDLTEAVYADLVEENILLHNIEDCGIDTYNEYETYFSYRRWTQDQQLYGGQYRTFGSFIALP